MKQPPKPYESKPKSTAEKAKIAAIRAKIAKEEGVKVEDLNKPGKFQKPKKVNTAPLVNKTVKKAPDSVVLKHIYSKDK